MPDSRSSRHMSSADAVLMSGTSKVLKAWALSGLIRTLNTLRRSPRSTSVTVPLTGATKRTLSVALSTKRGVPTSTCSPSLTFTLGTMPWKSSGKRAYSPAGCTSTVSLVQAPSSRMSNPFFILKVSIIYIWFIDLFPS